MYISLVIRPNLAGNFEMDEYLFMPSHHNLDGIRMVFGRASSLLHLYTWSSSRDVNWSIELGSCCKFL